MGGIKIEMDQEYDSFFENLSGKWLYCGIDCYVGGCYWDIRNLEEKGHHGKEELWCRGKSSEDSQWLFKGPT